VRQKKAKDIRSVEVVYGVAGNSCDKKTAQDITLAQPQPPSQGNSCDEKRLKTS